MQKIKQLPISEIQKIAAGQVIERPANVVKELVENSLDAGATKITISVEAAGEKCIRVVDNGCGMSVADAERCFDRHATSKISSFDELQRLQTFGFRGEALYAIGAVSNVTLVTKEAESSDGIRVHFSQGTLLATQATVADTGTDICIEDIFAHLPVRKKFLKKEETELRLIVQLFQAFCLAYPAVHFQLFSDTKLIYNCPATLTILNRWASLWDGFADKLLNLEAVANDVGIMKGLISHPHFFRYNRNQIFFFVNKRWVKNYSLSQALLKGYLNALPAARYPLAVVDITVDPNMVDVNVHPRKEEVKFLHPKHIENALTTLVKKTLEKDLSVSLNPRVQGVPENFPLRAPQFFSTVHEPVIEKSFSVREEPLLKAEIPSAEILPMPLPTHTLHEVAQPFQKPLAFEKDQYEILGVLKKTYILLDHPEGMLLVDQHAAHERVLFEQFNKRFEQVASVKLMFPEIITCTAEDIKILMEHAILLHEHGIVFDQFGPQQLIIHAIPVHLKSVVWPEFLQEVVALLHEHVSLAHEEFFTIVNKKLQAQMACKAAIKAGDSITEQQINQLLHDLNSLENRFTCPHGRPVSWLLPLYDIEKKFKRKK